MKKLLVFALFFVGFSSVFAADIALPVPAKTGGKALNEVLAARRSVRVYEEKELSLQQISDLLWAANGISSEDGKRTAPSAINRQEIELYVLLPSGGYFWDPKDNVLKQLSDKDLRAAGGRMKAPLYLLLVADCERAANEHYARIDTGYVSQNIYLGAVSAGMGSCAVGRIDDKKLLAKELKLRPKQQMMLSHPVGFPKAAK